uniref:SpnB-like Rossmann fold domain-containing protein n=1 Tax=Micromonospora wenchangensis TaxID=1185415 RepID=UPI003D75F146
INEHGSDAAVRDSLFRLDWTPLAIEPAATPSTSGWAVLTGPDPVATWSQDIDRYDSPAAIPAGTDVVVLDAGRGTGGENLPDTVRRTVVDLLSVVQQWLADERLADTRLVILSHGALTLPGERPDLTRAALPGLLRSASVEHPGRLLLVDLGPSAESAEVAVPDELLSAALQTGETEILLRGESAYTPRLLRAPAVPALTPPPDVFPWRLTASDDGTLEGITVQGAPDLAAA